MPPGYQHPEYQAQQLAAAQAGDELSVAKSKPKRMWGRGRKGKDEAEEEQLTEADLYHSPRPAFYAHNRPTRRTQVPRDVAVPYFRFRKDRFYDWPPDPTVSRATPILLFGSSHPQADTLDDHSMHGKGDVDPYSIDHQGTRQRPRRQRHNNPEEVDYGYG